MKRETPNLSDKELDPLKVTRKDVNAFLDQKNLTSTKKNRKFARKKIKRQKKRQLIPQGVNASITQSDAPQEIVYGEIRKGGLIAFLHKSNNNLWLNHIIVLASHEIEEVTKLYLDNDEIEFNTGTNSDPRWASGPEKAGTSYDAKVFLDSTNLGTTTQTAQADYLSLFPSYWTSSHRLRGHAHVALTLVWNGKLFTEGVPDIEFLVKGKKLYDPRSDTTVYSNNAALIVADWLTDQTFGLGVLWADIDTTALNTAANVCDEEINLTAGGTEKRYTINGVIHAEQPHEEVLEAMRTSFAGDIVYSGGKWFIYAGEYRAPSITLTADDLRSNVKIETMTSRSARFNSVRGTYLSAINNYEITDYPVVTNSTYVTEDNGETVYADFSFPLVTSATQAQRLAKIELEKARRSITIDAEWGLKALQFMPGNTASITLDRYGFSSKVFEIEELNINLMGSGIPEVDVALLLKEIDENVFIWDPDNDEQTANQAPATDLPDPFTVEDISGVTLTSGSQQLIQGSDGTVFSRIKVSWTAISDSFITDGGTIEIQFKKSEESTYLPLATIPGDRTSFFITSVEDGELYDVRLRSKNALGTVGDWVESTNHTVIGKTAPPANVQNLTVSLKRDDVLLTWDEVSDIDLDHYEVRKGSTWATAEVLGVTQTNRFIYEETTAAIHNFLVKAVDTSDNYSTNAISQSIEIAAPGKVQSLRAEVVDNNVLFTWSEPSTNTYPIEYYNLKKGATYGAATLIGKAYGTFKTTFEVNANTYNYWVTAVDTAGNESEAAGVAAIVSEPPDFVIREDTYPDPDDADTYTNLSTTIDDKILGPINTEEDLDAQFDRMGWATMQDKIDAGYTLFAQPSAQYAIYEDVIDFGASISSGLIRFSWLEEQLYSGSDVTVTSSIDYSADNVSYTSNDGVSEVFATSFRYVRVRLEIGQLPENVGGLAMGPMGMTYSGGESLSFDDKALVKISDLRVRVDVKKITDEISITASSGDSGGTTVSFNKSFVDVESIVVTPQGTTAIIPVVDFTDAPNPTSFSVYLFDKDGVRVSGDCRAIVRGI